MPPRRFIFDAPDRLVAGAVGQPGQRTFYLQAGQGHSVVTVGLEKSQVAALAERLAELLGEVERRGFETVPGIDASVVTQGLLEPLDEAFQVGDMSLGWDGLRGVVVVEARARLDEDVEIDTDMDEHVHSADEDEDAVDDLLRVHISAPVVRAFIADAARVVAAGRPPCPICGQPLNPEGHLCVRRNGYVH